MLAAVDTIVAEIGALAIIVRVFDDDFDMKNLAVIVVQISPIILCFFADFAIKHIKKEKQKQLVWKEIEWRLRTALEKIQQSVGFDWNFDSLPKFFCLACKKILPHQQLTNSKFSRKVYVCLEKIIQNWEPKNERKLETRF